jgi:hypothetical protein
VTDGLSVATVITWGLSAILTAIALAWLGGSRLRPPVV